MSAENVTALTRIVDEQTIIQIVKVKDVTQAWSMLRIEHFLAGVRHQGVGLYVDAMIASANGTLNAGPIPDQRQATKHTVSADRDMF